MTLKKSILFIVLILFIDQISKIYIKTHFVIGEELKVLSWFRIYFVENDGMAWGTKLSDFISFISDRTAKLSLTIFRIVAIFGIGYWLYDAVKKQQSPVLIWPLFSFLQALWEIYWIQFFMAFYLMTVLGK